LRATKCFEYQLTSYMILGTLSSKTSFQTQVRLITIPSLHSWSILLAFPPHSFIASFCFVFSFRFLKS
jgi:hypothetical protein